MKELKIKQDARKGRRDVFKESENMALDRVMGIVSPKTRQRSEDGCEYL